MRVSRYCRWRTRLCLFAQARQTVAALARKVAAPIDLTRHEVLHSIRGEIDGGMHVLLDLLDHQGRLAADHDLHAADLVDTVTRPVRVVEADYRGLDVPRVLVQLRAQV